MKVIEHVAQLRDLIKSFKLNGQRIGFVPTLGYLHEGHLSLFRKSTSDNDVTVASIFVNPLQFGPHEDFQKYPRDKKRDEMLAKKEKVDIIFYPSEKEMYPNRYLTYVETEQLADGLCGPFRPGHFRGVTTVVSKLLNIVTPDVLYLGQKDWQQAIILKKMVEDLNYPVVVKIGSTIREKDGLALSSRNVYLTGRQHQEATILYRALDHAREIIQKGQRHPQVVIEAIKAIIATTKVDKIDYIECVQADTLEPLKLLKGKVAIAVAVWFGRTRLIDNIIVSVK